MCLKNTEILYLCTEYSLSKCYMATIIILIAAFCLLALACFQGLGASVGSWILNTFFPTTYPTTGDQVAVYINGHFNRKATPTACCVDFLVLYSAIRCPVDYRGGFYAIGEDANGNILVYVDDAKHFHLVGRAERIRKFFRVPNEFATFMPYDDDKPLNELLSGVKEAAAKPEISVEGML